jgi:phenylalanyl-tRNA synthetase beta chain
LDDKPGQSAITAEIVRQYLTALGCELTQTSSVEPTFAVKLPSWRLDLEREIDLVEEIARVYGYNRFANTLPTALPVIAHPLAAAEAAVRMRLLALGYSEAISSSFASEADGAAFLAADRQATARGVIQLENPLSDEARLLRHRWRRECSRCSLTTSTAMCARCACSSRDRSSAARPSESPSRTISLWA